MASYEDHYKKLNKFQKQAVDRTEGPLLVLAGPGTGKTQLLSIRAANILRKRGISPSNILILTFTNAGARAMRDRLVSLIGHDGYNAEIETFHSFANSIVLESEWAVEYVKDKIEISEIEKVRAIEHLIDNLEGINGLRPFGAPYIHRSEIEKKISELKNEGITPGELKDSVSRLEPDGVSFEEKHLRRLKELSLIYEGYENIKQTGESGVFDERGRIDYDDMILVALDALAREDGLRGALKEQYRYIMVDEYQDTNGAQLELLFSIMDAGRPNLCCVGDDDQAIYRFQGATLSNFRVLKERLPSIETITLRDNYRSTGGIIKASSGIISQIPREERIEAKELDPRQDYSSGKIELREFMTEEEELAFLVEEIKSQAENIRKDPGLTEEERSKPLNNIAVLVRKRSHILKVVDAFLKAGIPYATDGREDIRNEKRVRQMLDVLELAGNPVPDMEGKSLALYRVLISDYLSVEHSDLLKFISFVNSAKSSARREGGDKYRSINLYQKFMEHFGRFERDGDRDPVMPREDGNDLPPEVLSMGLKDPYSMRRAAWVIDRLISGSGQIPVHDLLLRYINDSGLYRFILEKYSDDKVLKVRDLRALVSFVNMIKQADIARPGIRLGEFMKEMELRETHAMPVKGEMATFSQDGVRVYTAHSSKGLEFYTVFLPFCLERKSWPVRRKGEVIRIPSEINKSKEKIEEKKKMKELELYDELRLFYVASTRAKANLVYTSTPGEKSVTSRFFDGMPLDPVPGSPEDEESFLRVFLAGTRKEDPFQDTDGILKDLVANLTLNPTSLNNYIECGRKFLYDNVLKLPGRKNQHLIFGNCAHKALEEVYSIYMEGRPFPAFSDFRASFLDELQYQGGSDPVNKWCVTKLEQVEDWYLLQARDPVMPIDLENKLEVPLPDGLIFRGTFDKIEKETSDSIRVVDYKTGKPDKHIKAIANCRDLSSYKCDDYYRQLIAYKMLYERSGGGAGKKVAKGVLQFLEPASDTVKKYGLEKGVYRDESVELTDGMVDDLLKVISECWDKIRDLRFEKLPERDGRERCARCEYDNICWG
ncbi:MAG: AAA family ATPase [Candidatus Omnitrophica bacterium]|nr:AAA family ATPase [Candidatus Omnitrophota bacterium]